MKDTDTGKEGAVNAVVGGASKIGGASWASRIKKIFSGKYKKLIIVFIPLLILGLGVGVYYGYFLPQNENAETTEELEFIPSESLSKALESQDLSDLPADQQIKEYQVRGLAYSSEGNYEKALESFQKAYELNGKADSAILTGLIQAARNLNRDDLVKKYQAEMQSIIQEKPEQTQIDWLNLAESYYASGDKAKSLEYYQKFYAVARFEDLQTPEFGVYSLEFKTEVENRIKELQQ